MKHSLPRPTHSLRQLPTQPRRMRRRWQLAGALLSMLLLMSSYVQAAVIFTVGATGAYPTITAALAAVPTTLGQNYELRLLDASYLEDVLLTKTGSISNTLTIRPAAGVTTVLTGTVTFGAGSAYATLSGNNGTVARALTLLQPDPLLSAVVFSGDASRNTVSGVTIRGSTSSLTSGVVVVGNGVTTGNDNNTITLSYVGNISPAALPANLVYAASNSISSGRNDEFALTNSELANFSRTGVLVEAGNGDKWTISNNSFYYNEGPAPTTAQTAIDFHPGSTANGVLVSDNFIGGQAVGATGDVWENAGTEAFRGIVLNCGSSETVPMTNKVNNNIVRKINLSNANNGTFTALSASAGRLELTDNVVTNVTKSGTSGIYSLVSQGTTILSAFSVSNGQLMVVESGLTTVLGNLSNAGILNHTGGNILINGNFTNTSTGTFVQTLGDLEVKGNMLNTGQFNCSSGSVKLTGAGNQTVSGGSYFNLIVDGGGVKTFTDDADVYNGGVQMLNGVLATDRFRIKLRPLANLAETETSYVLGRVEATRTPVVDTDEEFGGMGLVMKPAVTSVLPGSTTVTRVTGTAPVGAAGRQGILRYFDITAATNSGLNVGLTIRYFDHELNGIASDNLRFFKSVDGGTNWQYRDRTSAGTGSVYLAGVSGFSRWTLGDLTAPLPVGLTAFLAERQGRDAVITWTTATERDNRGFGIEVSLDGKVFREIGYVAAEGSGTSSAPRAYRFVDATAGKAGSRYYRLRQDDHAGPAHYYGPQLLTFGAAPASLAAYPTQFGADLTVVLTHPTATTATLRLLDALGREVWQQQHTLGVAPLHVQPTCAPGSYVLTATVGGQVLRQRVVRD